MSLAFGLGFPHWQTLSGAAFTPASLFAAGEQGAWYDPSDYTTLFEDAAGTTPVVGIEKPVGLMLDKSKGLVLGSELVTNPLSITGVGWAVSGNAFVATNSNVTGTVSATVALATTKRYQVSFTASGLSGATCFLNLDGSIAALSKRIATAGNYSFILLGSGAPNIQFQAYEGTTFSVTISNLSVRELPGNHAYQSTTTSRPTLSAKVNLLQKTEAFDDAYWDIKSNSSITANAIVSPDGTLSADKLVENTATGQHWVGSTISGSVTITSGVSYTVSVYAKQAERGYFQLSGDAGTGRLTNGAVFNLTNGSVYSVSAGATATITLVGNDWYRCTVTATASANSTAYPYIGLRQNSAPASGSYTGDGTSGLFIWGADLRVANDTTALPYQRVNTATDYDTTGFPLYLRFDGSDDSFLTNSVDFSTGATNPPLGPELITNGNFSGGTTGWTAVRSTLSASSGVLAVTGTGTFPGAWQAIPTVASRFYRITFEITSMGTATTIRFAPKNGTGDGGANLAIADFTTIGVKTAYFFAASTTSTIFVLAEQNAIVNFSIDNISVKEFDPLYVPDRMSVFAGLRKLSDTAEAVVVELSATVASNNGTFRLAAPHAAATSSYEFESKGTTMRDAIADNYGAPMTNVISGLANISGDSVTIRVNSMLEETEIADQGSGNFGNYPLYIGRRNNASLPFNGRMYSLIILGRGVTTQQLDQVENYVEQKTFGRSLTLTYVDPILTAASEEITMPDGDPIFMSVTYQ